jgi:hypothetical protein
MVADDPGRHHDEHEKERRARVREEPAGRTGRCGARDGHHERREPDEGGRSLRHSLGERPRPVGGKGRLRIFSAVGALRAREH